MGYELLWLLLPLAAASGWLTATATRKKIKPSKRINLPAAYIKGLQQIIDQQHIKAVDTFVELSKITPDTVDTHIILGNLFRQRGEIEKAIATHQNVIKMPYLTSHGRANVIFELGRDYFFAGLFDRAERLFLKAISFGIADIEMDAYRELNALYEREKAWKDAIKVAEKLQKISPNDIWANRIAHYYCELADIAFSEGNYVQAKGLLKQSKKLDKGILRIDILLGDIEMCANGEHKKALHYYARAFKASPDFGVLILPKIEKVLANTNGLEALAHIKDLNPSIISISYLKTYLMFLLKTNASDEVKKFFLNLQESGSTPLPVLSLMLEHRLQHNQIHDKDLIKEIVSSLQSYNGVCHYQCSHCGFQSCENHWLCPGCHHWSTVAPCDTVSLKMLA
ncbi:MAG: hypothetical protein ACNYNY_05550 [Candidatus Oxydemutatoraceae bacterium WSBS_2016_MAG_OTU14]